MRVDVEGRKQADLRGGIPVRVVRLEGGGNVGKGGNSEVIQEEQRRRGISSWKLFSIV